MESYKADRIIPQDVGLMYYNDLMPLHKEGYDISKEFISRVVDILLEFLKKSTDRSAKVTDFHQPSQLKDVLDLDIPDGPLNLDQILVDCKQALKYQIKTGHAYCFNQLSSGFDMVSLAGEWLTAVANTNMYTFEVAPVFSLMEDVVLKKMRQIIGYNNGESIMAPGGSISNLYAGMVARHKMFPTCKTRGSKSIPQLVMYTSEQSHYSIKGAGLCMGLGTDFVVTIPCDDRGRMLPNELENRIISDSAKGYQPFFVNATSGTTVRGAFDEIHSIADICQKHGLWLHVDASWGGGFLLSKRLRHTMAGIERADSVVWNPHKMMGCIVQCSTIHFKQNGLLLSCNQLSANYLFQQDKYYDVSYDTGDKVPQCGRRNDVFKLWLMWRAKGDIGFERHVDHLMDLTRHFVEKLKERSDRFYLLFEPECTNVCFWYIPDRLRHLPHNQERQQKLGTITATLKGRMMNHGTLMIGYQPLGALPNFFRMVFANAAVTKMDVEYVLHELDRLGHDL